MENRAVNAVVMYAVEGTINSHFGLVMNECMEMTTDDGRGRKRANIAVKSHKAGTMIEVLRKNGENMNEKKRKTGKILFVFYLYLSFSFFYLFFYYV